MFLAPSQINKNIGWLQSNASAPVMPDVMPTVRHLVRIDL